MKRFFLRGLLLLTAITMAAPALSAITIYSNGPIDGTNDFYFISGPEIITNSFTATGTGLLSSAELGLATYSGTPASLQWQIGTTPFGSDISSGLASLTSTFHNAGPYGGTTYNSTFVLSGLLPSAGTYYLTLSNALSSAGSTVGWDENDGPSTAQGRYSDSSFTPAGSESFTLFGVGTPNTTAVPDLGGTMLLLGLGAAGLLGVRRVLGGRVETMA